MRKFIAYTILGLAFASCEGFFGEKTDLEFIDAPVFQNRDIAYVPIQPAIEGFAEPVDVIAGYDDLIYVADAGTEEIISFDQAGNELGRFRIPGLTKIAQDRKLNILAIGTIDTVITGNPYTLSAIYRIDMNQGLTFTLNDAKITNTIVNPFYFKSSFSSADAEVKFTSIDFKADNSWYATRVGPRDNKNQVGGPDDGIILFSNRDEYVSNVFVSTSVGFFTDYFKTPQCVTTFAKPPQSFNVNESGDFFFIHGDPSVPIKVQLIRFIESDFGSSYVVEFLDFSDTTKANDFLYRPERFTNPTDMWLTGDGTNYLFIVDSETDSLYQFTTTGFEGVQPPPGSSETKNIIASFGGTGQGLTQFNKPTAVTYLDRIVYVADKGNGRILRFQLTTDFD